MGTNTDKLTTRDLVNAFYCRYAAFNERDRVNIVNTLGLDNYDIFHPNRRLSVWFIFGEQLYFLEEEYEYSSKEMYRGCLKVISESSDPESQKQYLTFSVVIPLDGALSKDFYIGLGEAFVKQITLEDRYRFNNMKLGINRDGIIYDYEYFEDNMYFENQPVFIVKATFIFNPNNPILQQSANDELLEDIVTISEELRRSYVYELTEHARRNDCLNFIRI